MIDNYIPYKIYKTVFEVDYKYLLTLRVKVLLFDIDNTLLPYGVDEPDDKLMELFDYLKKLGFIICLISNNSKKRVESLALKLDVYSIYRANKPSTKGFKKAFLMFNVSCIEVAMIGDQMLTDIKGANKALVKGILVKTIILKKQKWYTKINRLREKGILKKIKEINNSKYNELMEVIYNNDK